MGETKRIVELKREELVKELQRPIHAQNKDKVRRLKEAIERHRRWERDKNQKLNRIKNKKGIKR
jgi:hypothetical protein